jgi:transposase-like protein
LEIKGNIRRAKQLRRQGKLLREIASELNISVATASVYCEGILPKGKIAENAERRQQKELVARLYQDGVPIPAIAKVVGIPATTLFDWRRQLGLKRNSRRTYVTEELRNRIRAKLSQDPDGELAKVAQELYMEKQLSTTEIAEKLQISATTVGVWLERAGIDRRKSPTKRVREKLRKANLGEKRYNWKGGITGERRRQRLSMYMRDAREACFRRDDYTCRACGQRGGKLNAHHVWPFQRFPDLKYEVSNLVTLCKKCHDAFHNAAGGAVKIALGPFFAEKSVR